MILYIFSPVSLDLVAVIYGEQEAIEEHARTHFGHLASTYTPHFGQPAGLIDRRDVPLICL